MLRLWYILNLKIVFISKCLLTEYIQKLKSRDVSTDLYISTKRHTQMIQVSQVALTGHLFCAETCAFLAMTKASDQVI